MEAFWKWLMRANARALFLCALLGLVVIAAWWTWKELSPTDYTMPMPSSSSHPGAELDLGLLAFLDEQLALADLTPPQNPFTVVVKRPPVRVNETPPVQTTEQPPKQTTTTQTTAAATQPTGPAGGDPPKPERETPPRRPETVRITYRGIFKRTDGIAVALVEDSKTKTTAFYESGHEVGGIKIGEIGKQELAIVQADGESVTVHIGEPAIFEGGLHVD